MNSVASEVRNCLCLNARQAARHLTQIYDHALRISGLRVTQFQLLAAIHETEPVIQQALSGLMGMDRTTLTRNLAVLQREGLIDTQLGEQDRRERHYRLTNAGRKAFVGALPLWRSAQQGLARQLKTAKGKTRPERALRLLETIRALEGMTAQ